MGRDGKRKAKNEEKGRRGKLENIKFRQASKKNSCCFMSRLLLSTLQLINVQICREMLHAYFHITSQWHIF